MAESTQISPNRPQSKLEEQATAKAEFSYSYWASAEARRTATLPPKKLSEDEARAQQEAMKGASASGASAWNQAGTFEERNVTSRAKAELEAFVVGVSHEWAGGRVHTSRLESCTGEAHVWIVRGKRRAGFEFDIKLAWAAEVEGAGPDGATADVCGTLRMGEVSPDDLEELSLMLELEGGSNPRQGHEESALAAARSLLCPLRERLEAFAAALKDF